MDLDSLSIKEKVAILESDLVRSKISRLGFGPPFNNDEFMLTFGGMQAFIFLINCEASNITGIDMVKRKYDEETIQLYFRKFSELGFMNIFQDGKVTSYDVFMDEVKEFYLETSDSTNASCIDEFLDSMVKCS